MKNLQLLMAIALAVAVLTSVECNPTSRDKRAVAVKTNAAAPALKPAAAGNNQVAAAKKPVVTGKNPVTAPKKPVVTGKIPVVAPKKPVVSVNKPVEAVPKPAAPATNVVNAAPTPGIQLPSIPNLGNISMLTVPPMPQMPPMRSKPKINPALTMLISLVASITDDSAKSFNNTKLVNFVSAVSRTKATADSTGAITAAQQDIFASDLVKFLAEITGIPKSVRDEILANVKKSLGADTMNVYSVVTEVGKNADSFTNKATGATVATSLFPLLPDDVAMGLAPIFSLAGMNL